MCSRLPCSLPTSFFHLVQRLICLQFLCVVLVCMSSRACCLAACVSCSLCALHWCVFCCLLSPAVLCCAAQLCFVPAASLACLPLCACTNKPNKPTTSEQQQHAAAATPTTSEQQANYTNNKRATTTSISKSKQSQASGKRLAISNLGKLPVLCVSKTTNDEQERQGWLQSDRRE